jgi:hypothetical protein
MSFNTGHSPFLHNNLTEQQYSTDNKEFSLKIDSKDRNIDTYPNPFSMVVKFNGNSFKKDAYDNVGPLIKHTFKDIKFIELINVVTPRYLWQCDKISGTTLNDFKISSPSIFTTTTLLQLNAQNIILNENDIIKIDNISFTIHQHYNTSVASILQLNEYPPVLANTIITLKKVKLIGSIDIISGSNIVDGVNTNFLILTTGDTVFIEGKTFIINTVFSSIKITVTENLHKTLSDTSIYLTNKLTTINIDNLQTNQNKKIYVHSINNNGQWTSVTQLTLTTPSTVINLVSDTLFLIDDTIAIYNGVAPTDAGVITLLNELSTPFYNKTPDIVTPPSSIYSPTQFTYESATNTLFSGFVNFDDLCENTLIVIKGGNDLYGKIKTVVNSNTVILETLFTGGAVGVITSVVIYPASYSKSSDLCKLKYIMVDIHELDETDQVGTNSLLSNSFGILYPYSNVNNFIYYSGTSEKYYPRRDLQVFKQLNIKIYDNNGVLLKSENLITTGLTTNTRHTLNVDNQILLTFRIICVDRQFN